MRSPRSLFARLAIWYGLILTLVLSAYSVTMFYAAIAEDQEDETKPETEVAELAAQARVVWSIAIGYPLALIVSAAGGFWIARRELAPLEAIARVAETMGPDALAQRIPLAPNAAIEVKTLITVLNAMLERLENALVGMQRFTADAAHELRTPLTGVIGDLELALRRPRNAEEHTRTIGGALEQLSDTSRLLDSLLVLARSDAGQLELSRERSALEPLVKSALEPYRAIAEDRGITLELASAPAIYADVNAPWLKRAIANLIDNACKFTPGGGRIEVATFEVEELAVIEIRDTGPGLEPQEIERAFERFYRAQSTRGRADGFGLGLAITRDITRGMGGEVTLWSKPGEGTRARIAFSKRMPR